MQKTARKRLSFLLIDIDKDNQKSIKNKYLLIFIKLPLVFPFFPFPKSHFIFDRLASVPRNILFLRNWFSEAIRIYYY